LTPARSGDAAFPKERLREGLAGLFLIPLPGVQPGSAERDGGEAGSAGKVTLGRGECCS